MDGLHSIGRREKVTGSVHQTMFDGLIEQGVAVEAIQPKPNIHRLTTYRRDGHHNIHVRARKEEATPSTPFDMRVMNDLDRFHLVTDVIDRLPRLGARAAYAEQAIGDKLFDHEKYIARYGDDMSVVKGWTWAQASPVQRAGSTETVYV